MEKRTTVIVLFLSFTLITSAGVLGLNYFNCSNILLLQVETNFELIVESMGAHSSTYLEGEIKRAESFIHDSKYIEFLKMSKDSKEYDELYISIQEDLEHMVNEFSYLEIDLWDEFGVVKASSTEKLLGTDYSSNIFYIEGKKKVYMDLYYNPTPGIELRTLGFTVPILNEDTNELLGIFAISMSLDEFSKIPFEKIGVGSTGEIYVITRDSLRMTSSEIFPEEELLTNNKVDTKQASLCLANSKGKESVRTKTSPFVYKDTSGINVLGAYAYIPLLEGCLIMEIDKQEATGRLQQELLKSTLMVLMLTIIMLIVFIIMLDKYGLCKVNNK